MSYLREQFPLEKMSKDLPTRGRQFILLIKINGDVKFKGEKTTSQTKNKNHIFWNKKLQISLKNEDKLELRLPVIKIH